MHDSTKLICTNSKNFPFDISDTVGVDKNSRVLHWHKEMEICHVKAGTGKYLINGKEYTFSKGDIFIINNDEIHLCYDDKDLIMQVVVFDPVIIWSGGTNIMDYEYLKPFMQTESSFSNKLDQGNEKIHLVIDTLSAIEEEYKNKESNYELMIKSLLLKLMTILNRYFLVNNEINSQEMISHKIIQKIKTVVEFIDENYSSQIKISELAHIADMSIPYFCSNFKSLAGISPMDYIIRKRISAAKAALRNNEKKILDIACECGFNSISNFNHIFKSFTGISPSKYRKS